MGTRHWRGKLYLALATIFLTAAGAQAVGEDMEKSVLVRELEGIFYADGFAAIPDRVFLANDFGAVGDGATVNTDAIQAAIDAAYAAGGGVVTLKSGIYMSGALFVKSNVELRLDAGVVIRAIQDNSHYPRLPTRIAGIEMKWPAALINVYEQQNVRVTGPGTIDGNGAYWWEMFWGKDRRGGMMQEYEARGLRWALDYDCERVRPLVVWKSRDVLLKDLRIERAGFWTVSLTYSEHVHVDGLVIRNNIGGRGPSSDGINTDSSSHVLVERCDIDCNDDNLCLKAGKDADGLRVNRPTEYVVYRNCITRAGHGLFTLGSETSGGMRHIEIYGLEANGTNTGIRFKSAKVRGGEMHDIYFHDIEMKNVAKPFHFELNWFPEYSYPTIPPEIPEEEITARWRKLTEPVEPAERGIPEFHSMRFEGITVEGADQAFYVNAYEEKPMHGLAWEDVSISAAEPGVIKHARDWTMEDVLLRTPQGENIALERCQNVELPKAVGGLQ